MREEGRGRAKQGETEGEREWKGEGKKGMILSGVREREGVEGGRDGQRDKEDVDQDLDKERDEGEWGGVAREGTW